MRVPETDYSNVSEINWARLATWIDGEGCIRLQSSGGRRLHCYMALHVIIGQKDARLISWLKANFGGNAWFRPKARYPIWYWRTRGTDTAEILRRCLPYLIVKREQAELALEYRSTLTKGRSKITVELAAQRTGLIMRLNALKKLPAQTTLEPVAAPVRVQ